MYNKYIELVEIEAKRQNIIRYKNREELIKKHLEDSLKPFSSPELQGLQGEIVDIGSGGGFPAIPLAIKFDNASFTLIESEKRKADFLKEATEKLGLKNVIIIHTRVETFSKENRERYDFCTMRAVASTPVCLEYASVLLKLGGRILLYKGPSFKEELEQSQAAMKELGIAFENTVNYEYTYEQEQYIPLIAIFKKNAETPKKYPRRPGIAKKRPL